MTAPANLPEQSVLRLSRIFGYLGELEKAGVGRVSSGKLSAALGFAAHSIRKDISFLGRDLGPAGAAYNVGRLRQSLGEALGLLGERKACVVGLGRLGSALLNHESLESAGCRIVAGFDSDVNLLETIRASVRVYPAHEMTDTVRQEKIEIAFLCVPATAAQDAADRLVAGGIRGIVNFAPVALRAAPGVAIRSVDMVGEYRMVSALMRLSE